MSYKNCVFLLLTLSFKLICCNYQLSLDGDWLLKKSDGEYGELKATVPGGIYTDLMANRVINDIMWEYNDRDTRWVGKTDWIYYRNFTIDNDLNANNINLVFEGLDTFSTITLNGKEIGKSDNMFIRYIFDITDIIKIGDNLLEINFFSTVTRANEVAEELPHEVPPACVPDNYRGECHVNLIRKMQASYAWDWGPAFPSMGIWKNVYLETFNAAKIRDIVTDSEEKDDAWVLNITTYYDGGVSDSVTGQVTFKLITENNIVEEDIDVDLLANNQKEFIHIYILTIPSDQIKKWWPNGYGEANLYDLTVTFKQNEEISEQTLTIGFRKVEIVEEDLDQGATFYFKINDLPIYMKGSNQIPLDILPERGQNPEIVDRILQATKDTNMNMLRVWGGGVYESDYFYKKADELGIMIWQDFMFACALYPATPEYLENVIVEIKHQTKRLKNHPSIVIWAGNNENEGNLVNNYFGVDNKTIYEADYYDLYINTIMKEFKDISPLSLFVGSSASNGKQAVAENYISDNPNGEIYGDSHYYTYDKDSISILNYPLPRFTSEFGFQSYPSLESWKTVTDNSSDLTASSDIVEHRQHLSNGLSHSAELIGFQFDVPEDFKTYIYYTQIIQAWSTKFETEYYRSYKGRLNPESKGWNMGSLYWQLNDVWVAPTWAGIDYTGRWKMLHYFVKNFFAPTIIVGYLDQGSKLQVLAITDDVSYPADVKAVIKVYKWDSLEPLDINYIDIELDYDKSVEVIVVDPTDYLVSKGCGTEDDANLNCFFHLSLMSDDKVISPENFATVAKLKSSNIVKANVEIKTVTLIDLLSRKFEIVVNTDNIALFVWLDSHSVYGTFSENGFLLVDAEKTIYFTANEVISAAELKKILTVTHLLSHK